MLLMCKDYGTMGGRSITIMRGSAQVTCFRVEGIQILLAMIMIIQCHLHMDNLCVNG